MVYSNYIYSYRTIAKFQTAQVAKSSPKIAKYHICQPFSQARAANVGAHAWTKLYNEIMSWIPGVNECSSCHA